jgi:dihydroorotase-like cyclic amidohydrolase
VAEGDDRVASRCGWTVYDHRELLARPEVTVVAGRVVYERG